MILVDANIVLRWLLQDHPELAAKSTALVAAAQAGTLLLADITVAEIAYVLKGKDFSRHQIATTLQFLATDGVFGYEHEATMLEAIRHYAATNLDFADCYLLARAQHEQHTVYTFDKALAKHLKRAS